MNARTESPLAADARLMGMLGQVERLAADHRDAEALRVLGAAEASYPEHPLVLHERARRLLVGGDAAGARAMLERVVRLAPDHLNFWLSLSAALRRLELRQEELATLERALAIDPTHVVVLLQKAALLDLMNKPRTAATVYGNALQALPPGVRLPPAVEAHVAHARSRAAENAAQIEAALAARIGALRRPESTHAERLRFDRCLDRLLGKTRIYTPEPTFLLFPFLANYEFYPREFLPWLAALEAQTGAIRDELIGVLGDDDAQIEPYIAYPQGLPLNQWKDLNHSRRWGAYFLVKDGRRIEPHIERCAQTAAAIAAAPQVDIPDRGPTAFFSILDARTKIPPHTGVTNTRLTVHLPLIVPPGCRFRVGGETREWQVGTGWAFDDTIEHEAWNDADAPRAILILDVWNPQLTPLEVALVREAFAALAEYNGAEADAVDVPR